jgi:hypothetical protein
MRSLLSVVLNKHEHWVYVVIVDGEGRMETGFEV